MDFYKIIFWLSVFCIAYVVFIFNSPKTKGDLGEQYIASILSCLPKKQYQVINNVLIKRNNGKTAQIDHIVVSKFGIFVIETKNYQGLITGGEYVDQWKQHFWQKNFSFYNPIWQNYGHIKALEEQLALRNELFISIIVFSSDAKLKVNCQTPVINSGRLKKTIRGYRDKKLDSQQVDEIWQEINNLNIYTKNAMKKHIRAVKKYAQKRK